MTVVIAVLVALALVLWAFREKDKGFQRERDSWRETQRELLQRIQAPEVAVAQAIPDSLPVGADLYVPIDDFAAWEQDQKENGLSG